MGQLETSFEEDDDEANEAALSKVSADWAEEWRGVEGAEPGRSFEAVDDLLGFSRYRSCFELRVSWARYFGLECLEHPYFKRLEQSLYEDRDLPWPPAEDFEAFDAELKRRAPTIEDGEEDEREEDEEVIFGAGKRLERGGKVGWSDDDGALAVPREWDEVKALYARGLYAVRRDGRWGLVAKGGVVWVPCEYQEVLPLGLTFQFGESQADGPWPTEEMDIPELVAGRDEAQCLVVIRVTTANGVGAVDQRNRWLVPPVYEEVAAGSSGESVDARWLVLSEREGEERVFDVVGRRMVEGAAGDWVGLVVSPSLREPLALVARKDGVRGDAPLRCRILWLESGPAFDGEYAYVEGGQWNCEQDRTWWLEEPSARGTDLTSRTWSQGSSQSYSRNVLVPPRQLKP